MSIFVFFFDIYAVHVHTISLFFSHVDNTQFYRHDCRQGIRTTAQDTCNRIDAINALRDQVRQEIRESLPKIYSHELVEQLFAQPYTRISNIVEVGIAKRQTASNYLQTLVDAGILEEHAFGKEKLFLFPRLVRVLTQTLK